MGRLLTLDDLQKQFELARERISGVRAELLATAPLPQNFDRDIYSFSYLRAERICLSVISNSLDAISWLPMQLDPETEIVLENKNAMKRWLNSSGPGQPDNTSFGNDFVHALTRAALAYGWQSPEFRKTALGVGTLFHDLSCLIGLIYYGVWMAENGITGVLVSDPYDLERMAKEISDITVSPAVAHLLAQRSQPKEKAKKSSRPSLRIVKNADAAEEAAPPAS